MVKAHETRFNQRDHRLGRMRDAALDIASWNIEAVHKNRENKLQLL